MKNDEEEVDGNEAGVLGMGDKWCVWLVRNWMPELLLVLGGSHDPGHK